MTIEISLRDVRESDLPIFFAHQCDPEATRIAAFPARDYDAFMAHWAKCLTDETAMLKTIVFDGNVVGNIVCWEQDGEHNVGYWISRQYWGKGIASAALTQFLKSVTVGPLHAHVAKGNAASIRVLEKCGFAIICESPFNGGDGALGMEFIMKLEE